MEYVNFAQWLDGSETDCVLWADGYPPVNHRPCLAAGPDLRWRDVHCQGDNGGDVTVCQTELQPHNLRHYHNLLLVLSSAFAVTLLVSVFLTNLLCLRSLSSLFNNK